VTNQGDYLGHDINQLLLRLLGAFAHVQLLIDDVLAKNFFEKRVPKAADFLMERVVSRIRDRERTKLVHAIAAEFGSPAELDNFNQVYMDVKRLRDKVGHAARVEADADANGVLHITDSYLATKPVGTATAGSMATVTVQRSEIDEAVRKCRWLEFQINFIMYSTDLSLHMVLAGRRMKVVKPSKVFGDWVAAG
jgi:hypothetical protein